VIVETTICDKCGDMPEDGCSEVRIGSKLYDLCVGCERDLFNSLVGKGRDVPLYPPIVFSSTTSDLNGNRSCESGVCVRPWA
jgi:hypothetical protein